MIIMGIDPGINKTGYAFIEDNNGKYKLLKSGIINSPSYYVKNKIKYKIELKDRLKNINLNITNLLKNNNPDVISIENPYYNKVNPHSLITQGETIGAILIVCSDYPVFRYSPLEVKSAVGVKPLSKKEKKLGIYSKNLVENSIRAIFNIKDYNFKSDDEVDAIAIAYCHLINIWRNNEIQLFSY